MLHAAHRWLVLVLIALFVGCAPHTAMTDELWFSHDSHTYEIVKTARTWANAAADAVSREYNGVSGALVRIDNAAENAAVFSHLIAAIPSSEYTETDASDGGGGAYAWIGATDRITEGAWIWDGDANNSGDQFWSGGKTGSPVGGLYSNWGTVGGVQNEPDNYNNQDAAAISLNGWPKSDQHLGSASQWNDINVADAVYYVVEYPVPEPATASLLVWAGLVIVYRFKKNRIY
jgi:hypothetical protein